MSQSHFSPDGVVTELYVRTKTLHREAERSGIIRDIMRGDARREGYVLLLRNLLPAYQALEQGLQQHSRSPILGPLASYAFARAPAIASDLAALAGARWETTLPLLAAGERYANRIAVAAKGDGALLIAHLYTRYLGDLSGGQIMQRLLAKSLDLQPSALSFYDFSRFSDLDALKTEYREAIDRAGALTGARHAIVEEGAAAFTLNIDLSHAVQAADLHDARVPTKAG